MTTSEKVAYLKGLAEGAGLDPASKDGKLFHTVIDILEDLAYDVEDVNDAVAELAEGLDDACDELADVEEILFGDVDELDDDDDDDDWGLEDGDELIDADDLTLYEAACPACGEVITFDEGVLAEGGIPCPNCGETLEFDLGEMLEFDLGEEPDETADED